MKIGIIRCQDQSTKCAAYHCFSAINNRKVEFDRYDHVEIIGLDTCGGCGRGKPDRIVLRARKLQAQGAEVIHLSNCLMECPHLEAYKTAIKEHVDLPIAEYTHTRKPTKEELEEEMARMAPFMSEEERSRYERSSHKKDQL